jgi:hypothetical protein
MKLISNLINLLSKSKNLKLVNFDIKSIQLLLLLKIIYQFNFSFYISELLV